MFKYFFIFRQTLFHSYLVIKLWDYLYFLSNAGNLGLWLLCFRLILNVARDRGRSQCCLLVSSDGFIPVEESPTSRKHGPNWYPCCLYLGKAAN